MVESGMTEGKKTLPVFFSVNEHNNTNTKPQAKKQRLFKVIPEQKQQLVEGKNADNISKVLLNHSFSGFEN